LKRTVQLEKDEFMLLSYNEKVIPIDIEREKLEYCRTLVYWLNWTNRSKKYTLYNDVIERSLLVLKILKMSLTLKSVLHPCQRHFKSKWQKNKALMNVSLQTLPK
jgi:hypothetical protein